MENLLEKMIHKSEAMQQVHSEVGPFIESAAPILLWGETGSGMGFYAKAIHEASGRTGKFLTIPGFALDADSVKQQFLGIDNHPGWLEEADKGTIFVKRISETSPGVQQILLHLLGNRAVDGQLQFSRKGSTEALEVNVRFIFSMAHDFNMALQDELLRRDAVDELKHRGKIIHIPPLRKRKEDIVGIAGNFFTPFNEKYHQNISQIAPAAQTILIQYIWPGNVDELKQIIETIFSQYPGIGEISEEHLPKNIINPEITGDKYTFKLKNNAKFVGKILSPMLKIESGDKKLPLNTGDLVEIVRVLDTTFAPPKFKHFVFRLKDGSQITGKILDKKMNVETSFDPVYQINPQDIDSLYLA